jgi:flavin reductase (DIM6/NTAB) family NADH-FMN oxidoreductase RutF
MAIEGRENFLRIGARDNFYQSCTFIPMSFALVTSVGEDGSTGIGPHALCFPFHVTEPYAMMLISRSTSATATNIRRIGRCALNYVEFDVDRLQAITRLGYPGQTAEEKRRANPFTLQSSPIHSSAADPSFPKIIGEAFQVFECTWERSVDLAMPGDPEPAVSSGKFVLRIDNILLKEKFHRGVEQGGLFPSMPIFMGFRANGEFWFAENGTPFAIPAPKVPGTEAQAVAYLANRLDGRIRFSSEACTRLAGIPRPFLHQALTRIVKEARKHGISEITAEVLTQLDNERKAH